MKSSSASKEAAWSAIVAEASAWIAMMHGRERTPAAERGLRRWLEEDPLHAQAFELATDTWNEARASVKRGAKVKLILPGERELRERTRWRPILAAAAAVLIGVAIGAQLLLNHSAIATGIGERRILSLEDGTQVTLNTATKVVVDYSKERRHVRLETGEALFDVARAVSRPFVVTVGDREVTALGTAFLVRRDHDQVAVTLMTGQVAVTPASAPSGQETSTVMTPGERLTFSAASRKPRIDRPELAKLTSWQQGKVHIEDLTLAQAITEMNRYSTVQLEVDGPQASQLHLSGVFRIGDSRNFANAVAKTHGLDIKDEGSRIVLSGIPESSSAQ